MSRVIWPLGGLLVEGSQEWQVGTDALTVFLHCLANTNFHPRSLLPKCVDLSYELLLQHVLLHTHESREVEHAVLDIFKVPRPACAFINFVEQIVLSCVENSLGKVGLRGYPVERTALSAWRDGCGSVAGSSRLCTAGGVGTTLVAGHSPIIGAEGHV